MTQMTAEDDLVAQIEAEKARRAAKKTNICSWCEQPITGKKYTCKYHLKDFCESCARNQAPNCGLNRGDCILEPIVLSSSYPAV